MPSLQLSEKKNPMEEGIHNRTELLLGTQTMDALRTKRVIILGVGGVGSWCAESLVRNGLQHLTLVDNDCVSITNVNRQLMATTKTIGQVKVEALRDRLLEINPSADIVTIQQTFSKETKEQFRLDEYDYIIDAIDSLKDKIALIVYATSLKRPVFFSSMGAALRIDPTQVRVTEFWKVRNDTLGAILRKRMRQNKTLPSKKFLCVYSEELPMENKGMSDETCSYKAQINGSLAHITGIFGMTLAGLVMQDIHKNTND